MKFFCYFAACFLLSLLQGIHTFDESWFFQVVCRVNRGDVLYRDVFFGSTPLSVYAGWAAVHLFGEELFVIKALSALFFTTTVWLSQKIGEKLGIEQGLSLLPIALLAFSERVSTFAGSLYNPLANLFFLACFLFVLRGSIKTAALFAALCFFSKHTHGILAILCLIASTLYLRKPVRPPLLVFFSLLLILLLPIYLSGGLAEFIEYGWTNKTAYLQHGRFSYFHPHNFKSYLFPIFILPFAAYAALVYTRSTLLAIFLTGSLLSVFPRAEAAHMTLTFPLTLLSLLRGWRWEWPLRAAYAGCSLLCVALFIHPFVKEESLVLSSHPHFQGIPISRRFDQSLKEQLEHLEKAGAEKPIFFINQDGGFYYLISNRRNPTPYDWPSITSLGHSGEEKIAAQFQRGEIRLFFEDQEAANSPLAYQPGSGGIPWSRICGDFLQKAPPTDREPSPESAQRAE